MMVENHKDTSKCILFRRLCLFRRSFFGGRRK